MRKQILSFAIVFLALSSQSQNKLDYSTSEILQRLEKLNTLGSVLYVAAHPDDENTQLISYMANGAHLRTGYLAATRGDGGQNLIGTEIRESLGVLRTQELLAARRMDGGEQFFARAIDFGYSKDPYETFQVWGKDEVLADFVWTIRKFKPDVMITRFSLEPGVTHGHHTASAILALEAFKLSGDANAYPEQLEFVDVWQPKRIFHNTGIWFYQRSGQKFNEAEHLKLDIGGYNTNLGKSYTEISALSRSMHKSQGFGATGSRGSDYEYFKQWAGDVADSSLFEGIDQSWARVKGSEEVNFFAERALKNFNPKSPWEILGDLDNARNALLKVSDQYWKEVKLAEIRELIQIVTGSFLELTCEQPSYIPGDTISASLEVINRSNVPLMLTSVNFIPNSEQFVYNLSLENNQYNELSFSYIVPKKMPISHPYWLMDNGTTGLYKVDDLGLRGTPDNAPSIAARISLKLDGQFLDYEVPLLYKTNDPVKGEVKRKVDIMPAAMVKLDTRAMVFTGGKSKAVKVDVVAGDSQITGQLGLDLPTNWKVEPSFFEVKFSRKGEIAQYEFQVTPPAQYEVMTLSAKLTSGDEVYNRGMEVIAYDHVPQQTIFPKSEVQVVNIPEAIASARVGYIMGAGDDVPYSLEQLGFKVDLLSESDIFSKNLSKYQAIVLGVRAFNTLDWLSFKNQELFDYVKAGGNLIVQYNTSHRLVTDQIAPYDLKLSRDRVTVENAEVSFLNKKHPVLNKPFKITDADFDGWVQERGLYFPGEWSADFVPILGMNDLGETTKEGSLLVAKYGKGNYCYTGLSFFRELPAGVGGAYKLLVNMIMLPKSEM